MAKKFKDTKVGKILGGVLNGAVDLVPGGTTVKTLIEGVVKKKLDRNGDGKLSLEDFKPAELAGLFGGLALLSILASKGVIDMEVLRGIAEMFGF